MRGFLLDENLPTQLRFTPDLPVIHATALGPQATDTQVWEYARVDDLVIITKDADFSLRMLRATPPPRVVHLRFGNMRRAEFHDFLATIWPRIASMCASHKLISVERERITVVA